MNKTKRWRSLAILAVFLAAGGCGDDDEPMGGTDSGPGPTDGGIDAPMVDEDGSVELPTEPPTSVTMVTNEGFRSPTDAVASLDGTTFFFAAYRTEGAGADAEEVAAIFSVPAAGGSPTILTMGSPLEHPTGLVLDCAGTTLFIADAGSEAMSAEDQGAIYSLSAVAGSSPVEVSAPMIRMPNGLAFNSDCSDLFVSGRNAADEGAVFIFSAGAVRVLAEGAPLVSPTGIHIAADGVAWVLDHLAEGPDGPGVLFSIREGTAPVVVASGLILGTPGGVSLTAGGGNAVVTGRAEDGSAQLTAIRLDTGVATPLATPMMMDPAGLRTARGAGVFAIADSEGGAIFRAE